MRIEEVVSCLALGACSTGGANTAIVDKLSTGEAEIVDCGVGEVVTSEAAPANRSRGASSTIGDVLLAALEDSVGAGPAIESVQVETCPADIAFVVKGAVLAIGNGCARNATSAVGAEGESRFALGAVYVGGALDTIDD